MITADLLLTFIGVTFLVCIAGLFWTLTALTERDKRIDTLETAISDVDGRLRVIERAINERKAQQRG
jgi:hypothetical protein